MSQLKKPTNYIYISLGSNIESRLEYLQKAGNLISLEIGKVVAYSTIYETPAWGFVSTPFLNACIGVVTTLSTKQCLRQLQAIEEKLGRQKKQSIGYEARPIDLDIIYSSEGVFCLKKLVVPHPLMQDRRFVLVPLQDIAATIKHPLLHKTTQELLNKCKDNSKVTATNYSFKRTN